MEIDFSKKICYLLFLVKFLYENIYKEFLRVAEAHQIIDMQTFKLSGLFFPPSSSSSYYGPGVYYKGDQNLHRTKICLKLLSRTQQQDNVSKTEIYIPM